MTFDVYLENRTPFCADTHVQIDAEGQELLVVMLSASFSADDAGRLELSEQQLPVAMGDEPFGDPALSSIRYEADIAPAKPVCEVIVNGSAYTPSGKPVREMQVGLKLGELRKVLDVTGDRQREVAGYSPPQPFTIMPIVYERAFGGSDKRIISWLNDWEVMEAGFTDIYDLSANGLPLMRGERPEIEEM